MLVSPAADDDNDHLASLLERAKTAGLAHEREQALLAGRAAIAEIDGHGGNAVRRGSVSAASRDWSRHALRGALDASENRECRR